MSRDALFEFRDLPNVYGIIEARNLKFGAETDIAVMFEARLLEPSNLGRRKTAVSSNEKKCKITSHGVAWGYVTHFWNYGTSLISRESLKVELNFKFGMMTDGSEY